MTLFKSLKLAVALGAIAAASAAAAQPAIERTVKVAPGGLYQVIFNPADNDVYIAAIGPRGAQGAAVIARHDGRTLAAGAPISVAANPLFGLGFNSRTQTLYGTDTRGGVVSALDLRTGRLVGTIRHGDGTPHLREVVVDEAANRAFAGVFGMAARGDAPAMPNQIWVINGASNTLERAIDVDTDGLTGVAHDARGNRIFVTGMNSNEVAVVDLATNRTVAKWPTTTERPTNLVFDAAGNRLFVASQGTGDLAILSAADGSVIRKVPTGEGALSVAYNPAVKQIYVANRTAGTVTIVNSDTYEVVANLQTGTFPQTIAIDRATNAVYVTNKARGLPRGAPAGTPVPEDAAGDTIVLIRP